MMNLEEIAKRIKEPQLCGSSDIEYFNQLSEKYPFAQAFSILYLKALSTNNDVRFDDELHRHAYRITDRMRLFQLINERESVNTSSITMEINAIDDEQNRTDQVTETFVPMVEVTTVPSSEIVEIVLNEEVKNIVSEVQIDNNTKPEVETTELREIGNIQVKETSDLSNEESARAPEEPAITYSLADKNNNTEHISENNELDDQDSIELEFIPDFSIEFDEVSIENNEEDYSHVEQPIKPIPHSEAEESVDTPNFDLNVLEIDMLSHAVSSNYVLEPLEGNENERRAEGEIKVDEIVDEKVEIEVEVEEKSESEIKEEKLISNKKAFSSWLKSNKNNNQTDENDEPRSNTDYLVDQFLKEQPSISRPQREEIIEEKPKTEFFSPIKKAKLSLDENSLPVSETLAKIFVAQGNFPKAIYAYEQLIAIYPEKKIFFANQIEALTKKLNT